MSTPASLVLHGQPRLVQANGTEVALERRAAALLALVALEPGISRLRVAGLLWPESADPRRNLRQQLLRFRQLYGQPLVQGNATLHLEPGVLAPTDEQTSPLPPLLDGCTFEDNEEIARWLESRRSEQRERRAKALDAALARAEAEQRLEDAIGIARARLADEPGAEAHHRTLIRLHYLNQDRSGALAAYQVLARMLEREYGARPSAETLALMQMVEQGAQASPGAQGPVRVWATALQRPPRLVGRTAELQVMRAACTERRALLVRGEAGMGKTRLLAECLEGSRRHVMVKAQAGDGSVPYSTLVRLLRRLLEHPDPDPQPQPQTRTARQTQPPSSWPPDGLARLLPEVTPRLPSGGAAPGMPLPPGGERLLLQGAVEEAFRRADLDGVAVDDLHFADEASLEMFTALAAAEPLARLAWLFTQRSGEGPAAASGLREVLEDAGRLVSVELAPLDAAQMVELVRSLDLPEIDAEALGPRLLRHSGGNPLFALETLKHLLLPGARGLAMPQPATVGALIDRRLKRLSDGAMNLARVAAIAGADFSIALAEHVIGARAVELSNAWAELQSAQVLRDEAFAHDLVHDAVLRSIPGAIAQHLHGELAQWLVRHAGEPARIAVHWQAAGDRRRAAQAWLDAARAADHRLRFRESMQCFEQAAALFEAVDDAPALHQAIHGAIDQAALIDLPAEAYAAMVERFVASAPDARARAQAMIYRLRTLERAGDTERLLHEADAAVALARDEGLAQTEAYALVGRGTARVYLGQFEGALSDFEQVGDIGGRIGDQELAGVGRASSATTLVRMGRHAAALAAFDAARAIFARHERWLRLAMVEQQRAMLLLGQGRPAAALEAAESAARGAAASEAAFDVLAHCALARSMALQRLGRYAEAMAVIEPLLADPSVQDQWVIDRLHLDFAQTCVVLGRVDLALRHLAQARAPGRLQPSEAQRALGLELQLRALGHKGSGPLPELPDGRGEPRRRCELLRARAALVPATQRAALFDEALALASAHDLVDERCAAQAAMAHHLLEAGQVPAARELMRVALADPALVPAGYPPAVAAAAHAVLRASGDHEAARRVLDDAIAWIERAAAALKPEYRSAFLGRNPVNRALLLAAGPR